MAAIFELQLGVNLLPFRHGSQVPHVQCTQPNPTRSPTLTSDTPGQTASTTPTPSWPRPNDACWKWRSVPQTPECVIRTMAWPALSSRRRPSALTTSPEGLPVKVKNSTLVGAAIVEKGMSGNSAKFNGRMGENNCVNQHLIFDGSIIIPREERSTSHGGMRAITISFLSALCM